MYEHIVVPLDGSKLAEEALPDAERLARLTSAPVHLVRVIDLSDLMWHGQSGWVMEDTAAEHALAAESTAASSYLETIAERLVGAGLVAETEVRRGQPSREVIAAARPGDLIVMAPHGRSGVTRWFLGSVAEEVVRRAEVPVLLVRANKLEMSQNEPTPALANRS